MIFFLTKYKIKKTKINNNGRVNCLNAKNNTHVKTIVWTKVECIFATSYSLSNQGEPTISGLSGNMIKAEITNQDLGFVGEIKNLNINLIEGLINLQIKTSKIGSYALPRDKNYTGYLSKFRPQR